MSLYRCKTEALMNIVHICTVTDFDTTAGSGNSSISLVYNMSEQDGKVCCLLGCDARFLWNVDTLVTDYKESHPRGQKSSWSRLWELVVGKFVSITVITWCIIASCCCWTEEHAIYSSWILCPSLTLRIFHLY